MPNEKQAQHGDMMMSGPSTMFGHGPTLGTIEHAIMVDARLDALQKRRLMEAMLRDMNYPDASAPLTPGLLSRLGGGLAGAILMRLLGAGAGGAAIGGIVGLLIDYYLRRQTGPASGYPEHKSTYRIM